MAEFAIDELHIRDDNPRNGDIPKLERLIRENDWQGSIITRYVSGRVEVLAGAHRVEAAANVGVDHKLPAFHYPKGTCNARKARRIMLGDNSGSDGSGYDEEKLLALLDSPEGLTGTGFSDKDLAALLRSQRPPEGGDTSPSEVPKNPRTKPGDVYELGEHTLVCADSTDPKLWKGRGLFDAVVTDPPYGVDYAELQKHKQRVQPSDRHMGNIEGDGSPEEARALLEKVLAALWPAVRKGAMLYSWGPGGVDIAALIAAVATIATPRNLIVWNKNSTTMTRQDYHPRSELCVLAWKDGAAHTYYGPKGHSNVWDIDRPMASKLHPTMKPIELIEKCIDHSTVRGEHVVDPFGGSGTTLIAAHNLERTATLVEKEPGYCDVIARRFEEHTGIVPLVNGKKRSFT